MYTNNYPPYSSPYPNPNNNGNAGIPTYQTGQAYPSPYPPPSQVSYNPFVSPYSSQQQQQQPPPYYPQPAGQQGYLPPQGYVSQLMYAPNQQAFPQQYMPSSTSPQQPTSSYHNPFTPSPPSLKAQIEKQEKKQHKQEQQYLPGNTTVYYSDPDVGLSAFCVVADDDPSAPAPPPSASTTSPSTNNVRSASPSSVVLPVNSNNAGQPDQVVVPNSSSAAISRTNTCPRCHGKGTVHNTTVSVECNAGGFVGRCVHCETCASCIGRGVIDGNTDVCKKCKGHGTYHDSKIREHEAVGCIYCVPCYDCGQKGYIMKCAIGSLTGVTTTSEKFVGYYTIVNVMTRMALDGNVGIAKQQSANHPRPFLQQTVNPAAKNLQWTIESLGEDCYGISLHNTGLRLDGNTDPVIPQSDFQFPSPFLWPSKVNGFATPPNHQWRLHKVSGETYIITNRHNNLALDSSTYLGAKQWDSAHPTPLLVVPDVLSLSQQWIVHRVA